MHSKVSPRKMHKKFLQYYDLSQEIDLSRFFFLRESGGPSLKVILFEITD